jgi:Fe-S cluster assembly protein SufB
MSTDTTTNEAIGEINKYDFRTESKAVFKARKGLDAQIVEQISEMKNEPAWISTPSRCLSGVEASM